MTISKLSKSSDALPPSAHKNPSSHSFCLQDEEVKVSRYFAIFKDKFLDDWIKFVMAFKEIENLIPMKEPADKTRMIRILLKG
jgi:hypothetical protein